MIRRFALLYLWYCCSRSWTTTGNSNNKNNGFVYGRPYTLLSSTRSKCFSVIAPRGQVITIEYDAPDLALPEDGMAEASKKANPNEEEEGKNDHQNGLDSQWNKRMKDRLERIKSKKIRDTSVTVVQKGGMPSAAIKQTTSYDEAGNLVTTGTGRIREELAQKQGKIEFLTGRWGAGSVEVCVQSILASIKKPARFHLRVDMAASDQEYDDDDDEYHDDDGHNDDGRVLQKEAKEAKTKDPEHLEHKEITTKMSRLERDLQTLNNRVKACLNNADYNKDQENIFHEQSVSMHKASRYWPIIQLTVLIVTGFTQANHIVRYLKTHHIGI